MYKILIYSKIQEAFEVSTTASKKIKKMVAEAPVKDKAIYVFVSQKIRKEFVSVLVNDKFFLPTENVTTLDGMKRDDVIPYYRWMIIMDGKNTTEPQRFADMVKNKWSINALQYIINKAWEGLM